VKGEDARKAAALNARDETETVQMVPAASRKTLLRRDAMTAKDLSSLIGKDASWTTDNGLTFNVVIEDAKLAYSTPRVLITPESGYGTAWVNLDKVKVK
jgi:hypothetical protein